MVAQVYASRYPERLSTVVLADTFTPAFVNRRDCIERNVLMKTLIELFRLTGYERAKGLMTWFGRKLEGDKTTSLRAGRFPDMATAAAVNSLRAVMSFHKTDIDLTSINVPVLILYGEHETSVIRRHVPTLAAEIPDATVRKVPNAGHTSPWDNPEFFNEAIREFLAQTVRTPGEGVRAKGINNDQTYLRDRRRWLRACP